MRLCNHCGRPMETSRYGTTHTLCEDCSQELRDSYEPPEDDMQPAQELAFEDWKTRIEASGRRWDQIVFSAWVVGVAVVLGVLAGMWLAWVDVARSLP